jgi:hypothetical protein
VSNTLLRRPGLDAGPLLSVSTVTDPRPGRAVVEVVGEVDRETAPVLEVCVRFGWSSAPGGGERRSAHCGWPGSPDSSSRTSGWQRRSLRPGGTMWLPPLGNDRREEW